jgi:hypothetical protein
MFALRTLVPALLLLAAGCEIKPHPAKVEPAPKAAADEGVVPAAPPAEPTPAPPADPSAAAPPAAPPAGGPTLTPPTGPVADEARCKTVVTKILEWSMNNGQPITGDQAAEVAPVTAQGVQACLEQKWSEAGTKCFLEVTDAASYKKCEDAMRAELMARMPPQQQ